jgi:hypothetical protein
LAPFNKIRPKSQGAGHCIYREAVNLPAIGLLQTARASNIEFNQGSQQWEVRLPKQQLLFSNQSHAICFEWEQEYFNR